MESLRNRCYITPESSPAGFGPGGTEDRKVAILRVRDLDIDFLSGGRYLRAVSGVSFDLEQGEITALVGESGCGKSASCLSLAGLLPRPQARTQAREVGFTLRDGTTEDLFALPPRRLRRIRGREIAYIFQEPSASLNPVIRIGDQIAEVLALCRPEVRDRRKRVVELLEAVGIPAPEKRLAAFPHELSGGMQQRVMIAMALAGEPRLLIADEPTTALDVTVQAQILDLIDRLRRELGMTVLLVTHNLGIVSQLADRVLVMYAGNIVESASAEALFSSPAHPYTRALLRAVPRLGGAAGRLETIPGRVPSIADYPPGCRFCGRCPSARPECARKDPGLREVAPGHFSRCPESPQ